MSSPSSIDYAKAIGLFGSGLLSGGNLYISAFAVPALLCTPSASPKSLHAQWKYIYNSGKLSFPPVAVATAVAFGYISYHSADKSDGLAFAASAISTLAIIPFTLVGMRANIGALLDKRNVWAESDRQRLRDLIVVWGRLNLVRSGLLIAAFGTALVTTVCWGTEFT